jgi:hypothetical protein
MRTINHEYHQPWIPSTLNTMTTANHDHRQPWPPSTMTTMSTANHEHRQPWPLPTMNTINHEHRQPWALWALWAAHEQCMSSAWTSELSQPDVCIWIHFWTLEDPLLSNAWAMNAWSWSWCSWCSSRWCSWHLSTWTLEHLMNKDRVDHPDWPTGRIWLDHTMSVKANGDYDSYDSWWLWWLDACLGQMTVVAIVFDVRHILSLADYILYSEWYLILISVSY